jgi:hypothetical protein
VGRHVGLRRKTDKAAGLGGLKVLGGTLMSNPENLGMKVERSRRNILKTGAILTSALVATVATTTVAQSANPNPNQGPGQNPNQGPGQNVGHCFLRGTTIRTANGDRKIEDLSIGDLLPTMFGGLRPIQWTGRFPFKKSDPSKPWVKEVLPIRIVRSALAPNVPQADLYVTQTHALFIDGVLVPAGNLINDITITLYEAREHDELEFFHIRLESHDVIYAEGAPIETLLNVDETAVNFVDYLRKYGTPKTEEIPCVPIASYGGPRRGALKSRVRSAISPWFDCRKQVDVIRDRLEERAIMLSRQSALASV